LETEKHVLHERKKPRAGVWKHDSACVELVP